MRSDNLPEQDARSAAQRRNGDVSDLPAADLGNYRLITLDDPVQIRPVLPVKLRSRIENVPGHVPAGFIHPGIARTNDS